MAQKLDNKLHSFFLFFAVGFLIRFPFFFRDSIDRDESTFILLGQSWVDGFLPYTQLWDLKPPLVFLFFAAIIYVFGKSFLAIRFFGVLIIALTALFLNQIGEHTKEKNLGFYAGLLYVYLSSLFGSLQGVMSEHLAIFFFVWAFWQFLYPLDYRRLFLSSVLFGVALMFRLNLAYPVVLLYLFYLFTSGFSITEIIKRGIISGLGGMLIPFLTFLPYISSGQADLWWNSVIMASLHYDEATFQENLKAIIELIPFLLIFVLSIIFRKKLKLFQLVPHKLVLIWVVTAGIFFMLIKSGKVNGHYLIQLFPFVILLLLSLLYAIKGAFIQKIKPYLWVIFLLLPIEVYVEYAAVGSKLLKDGNPFNGEGITVPAYIQEQYPEEVKVFFLDYHIGYWLLDKLPPSKIVTHPSNLLRTSNYEYVEGVRANPMEELKYILEEYQPDLIISRSEHLSFSKKETAENQFYEDYLEKHYELVHSDGRALVYKRREI